MADEDRYRDAALRHAAWLEENRRLWRESGPIPNRVGSKDAELIHEWAAEHPFLVPQKATE